MPGVRHTRSLVCDEKKAYEQKSLQVSRNESGIPRAMG
jgi:hypothetical protein